ncbi:MAG TPA: DUF4180 domain-containing protein [Treponemataceae bacterium]|nr:DUF4180 domain-containing protein [Treponemataceae bacterium]
MDAKEYRFNGVSVIEIIDDGIVLDGLQDLLDIVSDYSIKKIIFRKHNINENFFKLETGFAAEILKRITAYKISIGIVGDFEEIENISLRDFIYESNEEKQMLFKKTVKEVLRVFCR